MKPIKAGRERGAALLALLAAIMLSASWILISQINAESGGIAAVKRNRNAEVLSRAKQALIGYVAMTAATAGERNPGRLPCPEHAWHIGIPNREGTMGPSVGVPSPGFGSQDCASTGRLPWRTLGLDKLVDTASEPLWYVIGPSWRLTSSTSTLLINSNTPSGDISADGQQTVALIVAPGAAMDAQTSAGCTARNQTRSAPSPAMDARDYIECFDSATLQFVTTASSTSFNDQVVRITVADIMPAIEAAIAQRIEREIAPQLKDVYASSAWGLSSSNPLFPYPAQFNNPNPGTSNYQGASATTGGLLPVTSASCTGDSRCSATFVAWNTTITPTATASGGTVLSSSCSVTSTVAQCTGTYEGVAGTNNVQLRLAATATNVAMALKQFDASKVTVTPAAAAVTPSGTFNSDGSARILSDAAVSGQGIGTGVVFSISATIDLLADHPVIQSTHATFGWFVRNEWHKLLYYAPAPGHTAATLPALPSCTTGSTCLSVTNVTPASAQRAILILAGRSINGATRPSSTLADYFEFGNANGVFERQTVTPAPAAPYVDNGATNAYVVSAASPTAGTTFQFRAANPNTGASTLTTPATGTKNLVNLDGSNLAASMIQANAAVQVAYDGSQFLLSKRPFNDRIVVVDSN